MRSVSELKGLAVVSEGTGERLGRVHDVAFDSGTGHITGLLVDAGGLFSKAQFLPTLLVRSIGADAALVEVSAVLEDPAAALGAPGVHSAHALDGRPVLNEAGAVVGKVAGVMVDEAAKRVPALLLATGLIDNVLHGKPELPLGMVKAIGKDSLVVSSEYEPHAATPDKASP